MSEILSIANIEKSFAKIKALNSVSLNINESEMFGLVGPDGAGKTTLIKILCGLLKPDHGSIKFFEKDLLKEINFIKKNIGYLSQKFSLYGDLSVDENIEFFARIHNVIDFKERRNKLLSDMRLIDFRSRIADNLSGGMRQKLALACTLIHKPTIIFLDEPTTGVDPVSRREFWKILSDLIIDGITIFLTTPYLDEAERCSKVAFINKGEIVSCAQPDKLKKLIQSEIYEFICNPNRKAYNLLKEKSLFDIQLFGDRFHLASNNFESELRIIQNLFKENSIEILSYRKIPVSLENVFIHLIEKGVNQL